jgi:LPS sulfotransferase NodH
VSDAQPTSVNRGRLLWLTAPYATGNASVDNDLLPGGGSAHTTLIIASSPRSGTNMLGSMLRASGQAGVPAEYLGPAVASSFYRRWGVPRPTLRSRGDALARMLIGRRRWWVTGKLRPHTVVEYLRRLEGVRTSPNGVFAIKIFPEHVERMRGRWGLDVDVLPGKLEWVYLRREDVVGQAISHVRAMQTREWVSGRRPHDLREPFYDARAIIEHIAVAQRADDFWNREFERSGIEPLRITYSQLVADPQAVVARVLGLVGVDEVPEVRPGTTKQADELSAGFRERFLREHPEYRTLGGDP